MSSNEPSLVLRGLDGSNPLGFMAAVGLLQVLDDSTECADPVRLGWTVTQAGWRPLLAGCVSEDEVCAAVEAVLHAASTAIFDIGKIQRGKKQSNKFPFTAERFVAALEAATRSARSEARRDVDLLASFGNELHPDRRNGDFQSTAFKMVRSGDAFSQGMLCYAKAMRESVDRKMLRRTLFEPWDYQDEGYSLRWDPIEDQRHALRWRDPSESDLRDGPGIMTAANCLAVEALRCFPVTPVGRQTRTTGFHHEKPGAVFAWPIWTPLVSLGIVRSLLSLPDYHQTPLNRPGLALRGIEEVYGARQVRPNQYYINFAPALPIM